MISKKNKNIFVITIILNILVFLAITYIFIVPAQSQTFQDTLICQLEEHTHTDECFASYADDYSDKIIICDIMAEKGNISHVHDSFCYDSMNNLICPAEEYTHTHTPSCFNENNEQICGITVHQHTEQCFSDTVNKENYQMLICVQKAHTHKDSCYEMHTQEEIVPSDDMQTEIYNLQPLDTEFENQEIYSTKNAVEMYSLDTSGTIDLREQENGTYKYVDDILVSYKKSDEWIQIDKNGSNNNLPADADYRLEVSYKDIAIKELIAHNGKIMLDGIPNWLKPNESGEILLNSVPVASMQVQDGTVLITFHSDFMETHMNDTLNGTFFVRGKVDWHKLDDNQGVIQLPNIDMTLNFENNLPQKLGKLSILKSEPELVYNDFGEPYLKYILTVKSLESDATIPDVTVVDSFTNNDKFVNEYCGINETEKNLDNSKNGFNPFETRNDSNAGTVVKIADSKSMCWNIGNLRPNEERSLTYYAKLDPFYIGSSSRGNIVNSAEAFSSNTSKGIDSSEFIPIANAWVNKTLDNAQVNESGTGTITYKVEISASPDNNYDLKDLRLHDYVDSEFNGFVEYPKTITIKSDTAEETISTENPDNTSFNAVIPVLKPGEKITATYQVKVKDILLFATGNIDFLNTAELFSDDNASRGEASNYHFGSSQNKHTFNQSQWVRKLDGGNLTEDNEILINSGNAYEFNNSSISAVTNPPSSFNVSKGNKKYQVILNEEGKWDLSSAVMKDKFDNANIEYKGWLCIQEFNNSGVTGQLADSEVLSTISHQTPSKTVWLKIDGRHEFSFEPSDLGLHKNCTYLLTYYAGIINAENAGSVMITNNYEVYGTIGVGGTIHVIPAVKVSVSSLVQGNVHYNIHKDSWYYSEFPDKETGNVPIHDASEYENGALYWVIRADGDINTGFRVKDVVNNSGGESHTICADSIAGIYRGSKSLDFTNKFHSYSQMLDNVGDGKPLKSLSGNDINPGYDLSLVYDQFYVNNVSELDGKSFVIANFNGYPAVVTNTIKTTDNFLGLIGDKGITCQDFQPPVTSTNELAKWTFQFVGDNKFYVYTDVDGEQKYMNISGNSGGGNVSLSDTAQELYISQSQDKIYAGKIKISNENGMALNWYGSNGWDNKFSGWNANGSDDPNDFQTLLEVKNTDNNYDYTWFAQNANNNIEICFQKDMNLADDEALYIVVRTALPSKHGKTDTNSKFMNRVESKQNSSSTSNWIHVNTAEYILKTAPAVYKEGKEAYRFDGTNWIAPEDNRLEYWLQKNLITEPGTYAEWLININWDGSMKGLAEVSDQLPDYVTPVYLCPFWIPIENTTYPTIPELESDSNWEKMLTSTIPFYYNPATNELRWRVDNLEKETDPLVINSKTVNLQLICKINDPDILLSGETKSVDNTVTVTNNGIVSKDTGTVNLSPECSLTKLFNGNVIESGKTSDNKLEFTITVNPYKETLGNNNVLPPLIDEFSDNLIIIESSLVVKSEEGQIISKYTYNIENNRLIINKLPDKQKLIITYKARTKTVPDINKDIEVSNMAYWAGHEQPQAPQIDKLAVTYSMGGDVELTSSPTVSILKVDSENRTEHLNGADFALYRADEDNNDDNDVLIETGTTNNEGKLFFGKETTLSYDTVYYMIEKKAPNGYQLNPNEKHYFVILKNKTSTDPAFQNIPDLDIWESKLLGAEYECTIKNSKEKIRVEKSFTDENTGSFNPDSGKFSFGIFDQYPDLVNNPQIEPLQILEIEYVNQIPQYKLDNEPKTTPEFTIAKPNETYYVFELDESQKPVLNNDYLSTKDNVFKVKYTSKSSNNIVTISPDFNTISIENQVPYFTMPNSGGMGLKKYYVIAALFTVTAILIILRIKRNFLI